jgi:hypothetical protein
MYAFYCALGSILMRESPSLNHPVPSLYMWWRLTPENLDICAWRVFGSYCRRSALAYFSAILCSWNDIRFHRIQSSDVINLVSGTERRLQNPSRLYFCAFQEECSDRPHRKTRCMQALCVVRVKALREPLPSHSHPFTNPLTNTLRKWPQVDCMIQRSTLSLCYLFTLYLSMYLPSILASCIYHRPCSCSCVVHFGL